MKITNLMFAMKQNFEIVIISDEYSPVANSLKIRRSVRNFFYSSFQDIIDTI